MSWRLDVSLSAVVASAIAAKACRSLRSSLQSHSSCSAQSGFLSQCKIFNAGAVSQSRSMIVTIFSR